MNIDSSNLPQEVIDAYENAQRIPIALGICAFVVCVGTGLLMLFKPHFMWHIQHVLSVKDGEPSDFYLVMIRVTGVVFLIAGIVCMVITICQ